MRLRRRALRVVGLPGLLALDAEQAPAEGARLAEQRRLQRVVVTVRPGRPSLEEAGDEVRDRLRDRVVGVGQRLGEATRIALFAALSSAFWYDFAKPASSRLRGALASAARNL